MNDHRAMMRPSVALRDAASRHAIGFDQTDRGARYPSRLGPRPKILRCSGTPDAPVAIVWSPPDRAVSIDSPTSVADRSTLSQHQVAMGRSMNHAAAPSSEPAGALG